MNDWITYGWVILFFVGGVVSAWNFRECFRDFRAVKQSARLDGSADEVRGAATYELLSEGVRLGELIGGFLAGVLSFFHKFPYAILWFLFLIPVGLCINTIRAAQYRVSFGHAHHVRKVEDHGKGD